MEPALAGANAHQTAGGGGRHGAGLLVAAAHRGVLPGVAPGGKPAHDVGLHRQHGKHGEHAAAADEGQSSPVPRAEVGDDQEGDEEDGGGAEVAHIGQAGQGHAGEHDKQAQVPLAEEPFQGGGSSEDIADLGDLRGLHADAPDGDPVGRAVLGIGQAQLVEHHRQAEKADGRPRHEPADLFGPVQIPEKDAQDEEEHQPQHHAEELLEEGRCVGGAGHRQGQGGQEEGDGLHLKAHPPHGPQHQEVEPHDAGKAQEGNGDHGGGPGALADDELNGGEHLEHGEQHQTQPGGHRPGPAAAAAPLGLFLGGEGEEHRLHTPHRQHVAVLDGGGVLHRLAVDGDAALGIEVVGGPAVVLVADEGGVLPGYHRVVEHHVAAAPPAQNVLPVGEGLVGPVGQGEIGPYLGQTGHGQQGADGADEDEQGQHGKDKAHDGGKPGAQHLVFRQPAGEKLHTAHLLSRWKISGPAIRRASTV